MRCENCNIYISEDFKFAREKNQCPGCGNPIMSAEQLVALKSLQQLLSQQFGDNKAYDIATVVVENFELKQRFKTVPNVVSNASVEQAITITNKEVESAFSSVDEQIEVQEDLPDMGSIEDVQDPDVAYDQQFKQKQMAEAKKIIREQAYESAIRNQYGMGEDDESLFEIDEDENPIVRANKMKEEFKRSESQNNMLTGGGSFSRSS